MPRNDEVFSMFNERSLSKYGKQSDEAIYNIIKPHIKNTIRPRQDLIYTNRQSTIPSFMLHNKSLSDIVFYKKTLLTIVKHNTKNGV